MPARSDGLTRLAPGRWDARVTWRNAQGKKRDTNRVVTVSTEGGLRAEKARAIAERERIREDLVGTGDEWTVDEAIDRWLPTMVPGTRGTREPHAKRFRERFGKLRLSRVPTADVQRWLAGLPCSDFTANCYRTSMLALYTYARAQGRLKGPNPIEQTLTRNTPKSSAERLAELEAPAARRALLGDELPRFFAAMLERHPDLYPLVRCQLLLGCRIGEASALKWSDVDWDTGVITIRRSQGRNGGDMGPPKGKKARTAALGPDGLAFLRGHRAAMEAKGWPGSDTWAFPRPPTGRVRHYDTWPYSTVQDHVSALLAELGIDLACSTHAMRHSHVTLARALESDAVDREAGRDLRESVGHADPRLTETYTDESHRRARAASHASQLERRIGGGVFEGADVVKLTKPAGGVAGVVSSRKALKNRGT